jgi:dTDP-4-dehydrorhamnose reductase
MMRFAVLGAAGQLGRELCSRLHGEVQAFARRQIDLVHPDSLGVLRELRPDVVVNCAAYNFVDRAESEPETVIAINALGVRSLALLCGNLGCTLVHFSTNYVFGQDGGRRVPYVESDFPGPINTYGVSKLAGEHFVRSLCPRHIIIRTSGLYSTPAANRSFANLMLRLAGAGEPICVVNDQTCTPTYVPDLAAGVIALIPTSRFGTYHVTNAGSCTWFEFAQFLFAQAGIQPKLRAVSSAKFAAAARRPTFSVMASAHTDLPAAARLRPWQEGLAAFVHERKTRGDA